MLKSQVNKKKKLTQGAAFRGSHFFSNSLFLRMLKYEKTIEITAADLVKQYCVRRHKKPFAQIKCPCVCLFIRLCLFLNFI